MGLMVFAAQDNKKPQEGPKKGFLLDWSKICIKKGVQTVPLYYYMGVIKWHFIISFICLDF